MMFGTTFKLSLAVAIIFGSVSLYQTVQAAGAAPVAPSSPLGAGASTPPNSAPNSGMIPNSNSGMIPNTGTGSPTNPTAGAVPATPMNPATNPANPNNPVNPNNAETAVPPNNNSNVANPAIISKGGAANWPAEQKYWQQHFSSQPYATSNASFAMYEPAYQYGVNIFNQSGGQPFDRLNSTQLMQNWEQQRGSSTLTWPQAESATRDAYNRLYNNQQNGNAAVPATP